MKKRVSVDCGIQQHSGLVLLHSESSLSTIPASSACGNLPLPGDENNGITTVLPIDILTNSVLPKRTMGKQRTSQIRSPPTILYLISLNALICGIEFCASAGFTYIPPLLLKSGFGESLTTCLMGIGPFLALIAVPFIGKWSDNCHSRFGRRRPFILGLSLVLLFALILVPFGTVIGQHLSGTSHNIWGFILIAGGVVLLDFSCLAGFNPCEALVSDAVKGTEGSERGFMIYSCMVSFGGCIGYLITAVDWSDTILGRYLQNQEQVAFSIIFVLMVIALATTLVTAREEPLLVKSKQLSSNTITSTDSSEGFVDSLSHEKSIYCSSPAEGSDDIGYETGSTDSQSDDCIQNSSPAPIVLPQYSLKTTKHLMEFKSDPIVPSKSVGSPFTNRAIFRPVTTVVSHMTVVNRPQRAAAHLSWAFRSWWQGMLVLPCRLFLRIFCKLIHIFQKAFEVPCVMQRLYLAEFCSWTAVLCHNMFYTDFVGQAVYGGNPNDLEGSMNRKLYDSGVRMGCWGLLLHSVTACLYAGLLQDLVIQTYGLARAYFLGLALFAICMIGIMITKDVTVINICTALTGIGFATVTTIPNTLVTEYHANKEVYFFDSCQFRDDNKESEHGLGTDIAVLDSAYYLAQIILSLFMGPIVNVTHSVTMYILVAASFGCLACMFATQVIFTSVAARNLRTYITTV